MLIGNEMTYKSVACVNASAQQSRWWTIVCLLLSMIVTFPVYADAPDTIVMNTTYSTLDLDCGDECVVYDNGGPNGMYFGSGTRYVSIRTVGAAVGRPIHVSLSGTTKSGSTSDVLSVYNAVSANPVTLTTSNRVWYGDGIFEWEGDIATGEVTLRFNVPYATSANTYAGFEVRVWVCCSNNDIENITASGVTAHGASLQWTDNTSATAWTVCYGLERNYLGDTVVTTQPSVLLTGLSDNTPYYFVIYNNTNTLLPEPGEGGRCHPNETIVTTLPDSSLSVGCVDACAIHSASVRAYYGSYGNPRAQQGVVDFGSDRMASRHTVMRDTGARDVRTGSLLRTIPEGASESVRLGNWDVHNESECLVYTMVVDTTISDMLLLKYAAVLQNPTHSAVIQPRLLYSITKADGTPIGDDGCYDVEFVSDGSLGWNVAPNDVIWKDWTSVGMSLSGLHGETIQISLTTKDCNEGSPSGGTHFGYAYFTLSCGSMHIHYHGCSAQVGDTVTAPDGFGYAWYNVAEPTVILDSLRQFVIPSGGNYACDMRFVGAQGSTCSFTLNVSSDGLHPEADFSYSTTPVGSCGAVFSLQNLTKVYEGSLLQEELVCDGYEWHLPDGTVSTVTNPTFSVDSAGSYPVTLIAQIVGGCNDTVVRVLTFECDTVPMPDNIDSSECSFAREPSTWGITIDDMMGSFEHVCTLITPFVGDLDNDGIVEMVCFSTDGGSNVGNAGGTVRKILIFDGISHTLKYSFSMTQPVSAFDASPYGLVKLPNGQGLIVAACTDRNLYAYDVNGVLQWTSSAAFGTGHDYSTNVGFADFNNDGMPEVYVQDKIYDAATGVLLASAGATNRSAAYAHTYTATPWKLSSSFATNIIGDQNLELLLGNEIYTVSITNNSGTAGNSITLARTAPSTSVSTLPADGHAQVADFNLDGHLDVFISNRKNGSASSEVYGYVWDVYNNTVSTPFVVPTSKTGKSIPLIADIDNDDSLEVVIHCGVPNANLRAYKYHASSRTFTQFWTKSAVEDSYSNCMTLFDFNLDGENELLICDESTISIVNGSQAGSVSTISSLSFKEVTIMQYPVIADVDNDGAAEIVFVGNSTSRSVSGTLNVCRSNGTPWAPARPVWNQYMYNITNINKDLTVPALVYNNSTALTDPDSGVVRRPYNNFFQQATTTDQYGRPFYVAPDLSVTIDPDSVVYSDTNLLVPIVYCNGNGTGNGVFSSSTVYVTVYKVYNGVYTPLATVCNPPDHPFGQTSGSCMTQTFDISKGFICPHQPLDSLVFEVNSQGAGVAQNGGLPAECDTSNNRVSIPFVPFPIVHDTIYDTVCQGIPYNEHGFSIPTDTTSIVGLHVFTDTISGPCNSYLSLFLTVVPSQNDTIVVKACEHYVWNGRDYTESGAYCDTISVTSHCYELQTLVLKIWHNEQSDIQSVVACQNFMWRGVEYDQSGVVYDTVVGAVHTVCDSVYVLDLMIYNDVEADVQTVDACGAYVWRGVTLTTAGLYSDTVGGVVHGVCDSIYTLSLNVYHDALSAQEAEACETYVWHGSSYSSTGYYADTVHNAVAGVCDSIYYLTLEIYRTKFDTVSVTACDQYLWRGDTCLMSGFYSDTVTGAVEGICDSIYTLNLLLYHSVYESSYQTVCDSISWLGTTYTASGTYNHVFPNAVHGVCDSVCSLFLTVYKGDTVSVTERACESYSWFGTDYTMSGRYEHISPRAIQGICDSVYILQLSVSHNVLATLYDTVCDALVWHGKTYAYSGAYFDTVRGAVDGVCDSTYKLYLKVRYSSSSIVTDTVNENDLPYTFCYRTYTEEVKDDTLVFVNSQQCDSVVYFSLFVFWHYETCSQFLQFPNLVTPNGDGVNDRFVIKNLIEEDCYPHNRLCIYNRWGSRVFMAENISSMDDFWDPNVGNIPDGTYFFTFVGSGLKGKVERHGVIEVLR